jgi:hypothetical protein
MPHIFPKELIQILPTPALFDHIKIPKISFPVVSVLSSKASSGYNKQKDSRPELLIPPNFPDEIQKKSTNT